MIRKLSVFDRLNTISGRASTGCRTPSTGCRICQGVVGVSRFGKEQVMVSKMLSMKPAYLKEKTPEAVWSDLKGVISHF